MLILSIDNPLQKQLLEYFLRQQNFPLHPPTTDSSVTTPACVVLTDQWHQGTTDQSGFTYIWLLDLTQTLPTTIPPTVLGLLNARTSLTDLETCIRQVGSSQRYIGPDVLACLMQPKAKSVTHEDTVGLTPREKEVLALMRTGLSLRAIAEALFLSEHTTENHRASIQRKLGLTGRLSLVRYATQTA